MKPCLVFITLGALFVPGCRRPNEPTIDQHNSDTTADEISSSGIDAEEANILLALDQIVQTVLTSHNLSESRKFYGTEDDTRCALVTNEYVGIAWPESYIPKISGIEFVRAKEGSPVEPINRRLLGIRIDKLDLNEIADERGTTLFGGPVQISLLNAGGDPNGVIVQGGAIVNFTIEWEEGKPKLNFAGSLDL